MAVVVITGAGAGVGRALARELADRGARVALLGRNPDRLEAALSEVRARGSEGVAIAVDVADPEALERAAAQIERTLGPIAVWINNAMVTVMSPVRDVTPEELRRVTDVTYHGVVFGTQVALRRMVPRDRGHVIQVGSALAHRGIPYQAPYCAAKHAVRGFTDALRSELLHDGSRVHLTMVQLPALNTPQFQWSRTRLPSHPQPVPPIFQPEVAALAIADAIGSHRREIYVGAPTWKTVLGAHFAPGLVDHILARTGWSSQQAPALLFDPNRPDNLFAPVGGIELAAHGAFGARAKERSIQSMISRAWTWLRRWLTPGPALEAGYREDRG